MEALSSKKVDAIVYDRPLLLHGVKESQFHDIRVLKDKINQEVYSIALQEESPYTELINRALLEHMNHEKWDKMLDKYLGFER